MSEGDRAPGSSPFHRLEAELQIGEIVEVSLRPLPQSPSPLTSIKAVTFGSDDDQPEAGNSIEVTSESQDADFQVSRSFSTTPRL